MHRNGEPNPETARGLVATVAEIFFATVYAHWEEVKKIN
jgi:hypothetical protein